MIGLPSAVCGAIAGLIFASVMTPIQVGAYLGLKGRVALGTIVGATAGIVFMNLLAHSVLTIFLAAFLGGALAARFVRSEATYQP
jgi:chromate transport protein ChrA